MTVRDASRSTLRARVSASAYAPVAMPRHATEPTAAPTSVRRALARVRSRMRRIGSSTHRYSSHAAGTHTIAMSSVAHSGILPRIAASGSTIAGQCTR